VIRALLMTAALASVPAAFAGGPRPNAAPAQAHRGPDLPAVVRVGVLGADGRYLVTPIPLEAYVARVLSGEAMRASAPPALEALAVAIRTFAVANLGRHRADGFDLCDQTHCQVMRTATPATERAAEATAGALLLRNGTLASIYYTASCGGRTEKPSAVWPGAEDPPYLPVKNDDACQGAPAWSAELSAADLLRAFRSAGFRGSRLADMRVAGRTGSGRVASLQLDGLQPSSISGQDLRVAVGRTIGWQHLKSTAFDLRKRGDMYRFDGHGSGHGVGLCVIGSARLAEQGRSAIEILGSYFPGLEVSRPLRITSAVAIAAGASLPSAAVSRAEPPPIAPAAVSPRPADDDESRRSIERQVSAAGNELAKILGVPPPGVTLRVHPTTESYERATGRPWFTAGTAVNRELHLVPPAALRDRGLLDQTIRRTLVHLIVDDWLKDRPAWVRDGAALYYADPRRAAPQDAKGPCPGDGELLRPVSIGELSLAYARAKACFARQIAAGRGWRDVR
jgi:SpoIID/LytB domain protein